MEEFQLEVKNDLTMKLLHYFVTIEGYNPVILRGVTDEIWLEKVDSEYKFIRIVSKPIKNQEQYEEDINKSNKIRQRLAIKTFSIEARLINIYIDLNKKININQTKKITIVAPLTHNKFNQQKNLVREFGNIDKQLEHKETGKDLFIKITNDINIKNRESLKQNNEIFKPKKPYATYTIITINILIFLAMELFGYGSTNTLTLLEYGAIYTPLVRAGDYYRLFTSIFLHIGIVHLFFNNYALYLIGKQVETFYGHIKFLIIYIFSGLLGSLLSITFNTGISAGASGAIFGLLGATLYFGYHYRMFLQNFLKKQIIPVILINLAIGFMISGINNYAHIGGLIGGIVISMIVGIKYKTKKFEQINALAASIILIGFLGYLSFFYNDVYRNKEFDNTIIEYYKITNQPEKAETYEAKVTKFD